MKQEYTDLHTRLLQETEHVRLSEDEKIAMRERLVEYCAYKPIRSLQTEHQAKHRAQRSPFAADVWHLMKTRYLPGALMLTLIFGASISYAAEDSVPGETLYPLKVNITEELVGAFSFTEEAKASWGARRAERRLKEASELVMRGDLTSETSAEVAALFSLHADEATKRTEDLEEHDPALAAEMSATLESALEAQEAILMRLSVEQGDVETRARELAGNIRSKVKALARIRVGAEQSILATTTNESATGTASVAERMGLAAKKGLHDARDVIADSSSLEGERKERLEVQLTVAEVRIQKGDEALAQGSSGQAYLLYKDAFSLVQKIVRFLNAETEFNIDALAIDVLDVLPIIAEEDAHETTLLGTGLLSGSNETIEDSAEVDAALGAQEKAQAVRKDMEEHEQHHTLENATQQRYDEILTNAQTLMVRAEVAFASDDFDDATRFFNRAAFLFNEALEMLHNDKNSDKNGATQSNNEEEQIGGAATSTPSETTDREDKQAILDSLTHNFASGTHTFIAVLRVPNTCTKVEGDAAVAELLPEQITLSFVTKGVPTTCAEVEEVTKAEVTVVASKFARLHGVSLNGENIENIAALLVEANPQTPIEVMQTTTESKATVNLGTSSLESAVENKSNDSPISFQQSLRNTFGDIQKQLRVASPSN